MAPAIPGHFTDPGLANYEEHEEDEMRPATIDDSAPVEVLRQRRAAARHKLRLIQDRQHRMRPATVCALLGVAILGAALVLRAVLL